MSNIYPYVATFDGPALFDPVSPGPAAFTVMQWLKMDPAQYNPSGFYVGLGVGAGDFDYVEMSSYADDGKPWKQAVYLSTTAGLTYERVFDGTDGAAFFSDSIIVDPRNGWTMFAWRLDEANFSLRLYDKQNGIFRITDCTEPVYGSLPRAQTLTRSFVGGAPFDPYRGPFDWIGWMGPRYVWKRLLSDAEVRTQSCQVSPVSRANLLYWHPGLDQVNASNFANGIAGEQYLTSAIAGTNPPIPWTRSGMLL